MVVRRLSLRREPRGARRRIASLTKRQERKEEQDCEAFAVFRNGCQAVQQHVRISTQVYGCLLQYATSGAPCQPPTA
jgi:hypothetical protein